MWEDRLRGAWKVRMVEWVEAAFGLRHIFGLGIPHHSRLIRRPVPASLRTNDPRNVTPDVRVQVDLMAHRR